MGWRYFDLKREACNHKENDRVFISRKNLVKNISSDTMCTRGILIMKLKREGSF